MRIPSLCRAGSSWRCGGYRAPVPAARSGTSPDSSPNRTSPLRRVALVGDAVLVLDVQLEVFAGRGVKYPVLRIDQRPEPVLDRRPLHGVRRRVASRRRTGPARRPDRRRVRRSRPARSRRLVLHRRGEIHQPARSLADRLAIGTIDRHAIDEDRAQVAVLRRPASRRSA